MKKKDNPGCCGCGTAPTPLACTPCAIPLSDLVLTWYYWQVHYGGPYGTTYVPAGPITTPLAYYGPTGSGDGSYAWTSGWFRPADDSSTCNPGVYREDLGHYVLGSDCCYVNFSLTCSHAGGTQMGIGLSSHADGSFGASYCYDGTVQARVGLAHYSCSPFSVVYDATGYVGNLFAGGIVSP